MATDVITALHTSFQNGSLCTSAYLKALTCAVDEQLIQLWEHSGLFQLNTHLIALGGYGRHQLFPHSDIDTLILIPSLSPEIEAAMAYFHQEAWDQNLKIHLSHESLAAPRGINEVDLSTQTSWLEARLIVGDPLIYHAWHHRYVQQALKVREFIQAKFFEQQQRHIRFEEAEATLEPNVKEHPGGLRDLHTLFWIDRAQFGRRLFYTLFAHYGLSSHEIRRLQRAHTFLCTVRAHLHLISGRQEDTLRYDLHLPLAHKLGVHRNASRLHASERLMQHYYRMSRLILQTNRLFIAQLQHRPPPAHLLQGESTFFIYNHQLCVRHAQCFQDNPAYLFEVFVVWQNTPGAQDIHPATQRAMWEHRHALDHPEIAVQERLQAAFIAILKSRSRVFRSIRTLHQLELLERYLPDWRRIRGQIQHDYMHRYPLDEHNLMVLRYLRRMKASRFSVEMPELRLLLDQFERPEVLWIAGLFHDIGKGLDGDHSSLGAAKARHFAELHDLPSEDVLLIEWLVQEHLTLSHVAQKHDIHNPDVLAAFLSKIPSERALIALYLLTVADIRGTNPSLWNPWRSHLLSNLFHHARAALRHEGIPAHPIHSIQQQVQRLRAAYYNEATPPPSPSFWTQLEPSYFYRHTPEEMAWHSDILTQTPEHLITGRYFQGTWQFFIHWPDQQGIFSRLCSFFSARRLSIVEAKIITSLNGWIFDSYSVLVPDYEWDHTDIESIYQELYTVLESPFSSTPIRVINPPRLSRRQQALPLHPEIQLDPDTHHKGRFTLHIMAADRPNLWSDVARSLWLSNISVHDARIQSLGERIEGCLSLSSPRLHIADEQAVLEARLFRLLYKAPHHDLKR